MDILELIENAKHKANLNSDYALAKAMGIDRAVVSQWRAGKRHPSNEEAVQLATLAGIDEMRVIAEIELRTAKNEKKRAFWQHYIERRGLAACISMTALAVAIIATPEPAEAGESILQMQNYGGNSSTIYIMRKRLKQKKLIIYALYSKYTEFLKNAKNGTIRLAFQQ